MEKKTDRQLFNWGFGLSVSFGIGLLANAIYGATMSGMFGCIQNDLSCALSHLTIFIIFLIALISLVTFIVNEMKWKHIEKSIIVEKMFQNTGEDPTKLGIKIINNSKYYLYDLVIRPTLIKRVGTGKPFKVGNFLFVTTNKFIPPRSKGGISGEAIEYLAEIDGSEEKGYGTKFLIGNGGHINHRIFSRTDIEDNAKENPTDRQKSMGDLYEVNYDIAIEILGKVRNGVISKLCKGRAKQFLLVYSWEKPPCRKQWIKIPARYESNILWLEEDENGKI